MKRDASTRRYGLMLASAIATISACRDSTPIGSVECIGEHIQCGFAANQRDASAPQLPPPLTPISTTGLDVLMPVWSGQPFEDRPEFRLRLVADADAQLWSFAQRDERVRLSKLDREGNVLDERTIEPPEGPHNPVGLSVAIADVSPAGANSSTTVTVQWIRACDGRAGEPPDCNFNELVVFESLDREPRRVDLGLQSGLMQANASGVWLLDNYGPHIDKLDLSAKLIWRQTGLLHLQGQYATWQLSEALLPAGEVSVLLSTTQNEHAVGLELWRLNVAGDITDRQSIAWSGLDPQYAIDVRGRDVIVGPTWDGDLMLMRVLSNGSSEGNQIMREDYRALRVDGFTLDSEGAAYVASAVGGREPKDGRELLCQLPDSGALRCFTLGEISSEVARPLIDEFVVTEPGVVYVRSGSELRRYELPPAPQ